MIDDVRCCCSMILFDNVHRGRTALMIAAAMGDMTTVLALLRMPGVDRRVACAHGKDAVDYAVQYGKRVVVHVTWYFMVNGTWHNIVSGTWCNIGSGT